MCECTGDLGRRPRRHRQRVALVRRRPVLLLDEPFAALGPVLRHEMPKLRSVLVWSLRRIHRRQPGDESAMLGRIDAPVQLRKHRGDVSGEQGIGREAESGEDAALDDPPARCGGAGDTRRPRVRTSRGPSRESATRCTPAPRNADRRGACRACRARRCSRRPRRPAPARLPGNRPCSRAIDHPPPRRSAATHRAGARCRGQGGRSRCRPPELPG